MGKNLELMSLAFVTLLTSFANLQADSYLFLLNRFGGIEIETEPKPIVKFFQANKQEEEIIFESRLMEVSPYLYTTIDGVRFQIDKLLGPVIHDTNRGINSGDYRLRITDKNNLIKSKLPNIADFAKSEEEMTFYGEKTSGN